MNKTNVVSAGAQEVIEITGDVSAAPWLGAPDADPESVGAAPFDPLTGLGAVGSLLADPAALRVNFQPATTDTPDGWRSDTGRAYAGQADGKTYGWESLFGGTPAPMPVDRDRIGRPLYDTLGFLTRSLIIPQQWSIALPNGTYPVVIMVGDASSRVHTDSLLINGQFRADPTPWDGQLTNGYEQGQFDAITAQVTVTTGKLTIRPAWLAGAFLPRINFIEIGSIGTTLDAATIARAQAAALLATQQTGLAKPKTPPLIKRNIWSGGYVDELASYTLTKPRKAAVRYFAHSNHLFSISAVTNSAGQVVERYSYNAYGVRTVKNPANVVIAKSAVNSDRGFTSYKLDGETGLYAARARMYSGKLGRFVNRDPMGYFDGYTLYEAFFIPLTVDPNGTTKSIKCVRCWKMTACCASRTGDWKYTCSINDDLDPGYKKVTEANDYPNYVPKEKGNQKSSDPGNPYGENGPLAPGSYKATNHPMGTKWGRQGVLTNDPNGKPNAVDSNGAARDGIMFHDQYNKSNGCITCVDDTFDDAVEAAIDENGGSISVLIVDAGDCPCEPDSSCTCPIHTKK